MIEFIPISRQPAALYLFHIFVRKKNRHLLCRYYTRCRRSYHLRYLTIDPLFFVLSNHEVLHTFQDHLIRLVCLSISLNPFFVEGFNFQFLLSHTTNSCGLPHLIVIGCFLLRCFETQPGNFSSNKDCFHLRTLLS